MVISQYLQTLLADWIAGMAMPAPPASMVMHLSTADPGDAGTGIVTIGGAHTNTVTFAAPVTNETQGATTANTAPMAFVGLPAVTITHISILDNVGNPLMYGPIDVPIVTTAGGGASFSVSDISFAMGGFASQYLGEAVINWMRGTAMPAAPTSLLCALSTANPLRDGSALAEPAATDNYARKTYTLGAPVFTANVGTTIANSTDFLFNICHTNAWGAISHIAIMDQAANMLFTGAITSPQVVHSGETFGVAANGLAVLLK